jgi:hypothetical protein
VDDSDLLLRYNCYMKVGVHEAMERFSDMLDRITIGEEVIITHKGEPVARADSSNDEETWEVSIWLREG